jgi:DNA repair exonuclease SbcCD ATPase subunit
MKRTTSAITVTCLLFVGVSANAMQKTTKDQLQKLNELRKELESVEIQRAGAEAEQASLAKENDRLTASADLLHHANLSFVADRTKHNLDGDAQNRGMNGHNAKGCTYRAGHPEDCAAWVAEGERLVAWGVQVDARKANLEIRRKLLRDRQGDLSRATEDCFSRKKANNAKLEDLEAKESDLVDRVKRLMFDDSFLNDLRLRKIISNECAEMMTPEDASQCLQAVWDGARRVMPHRKRR